MLALRGKAEKREPGAVAACIHSLFSRAQVISLTDHELQGERGGRGGRSGRGEGEEEEEEEEEGQEVSDERGMDTHQVNRLHCTTIQVKESSESAKEANKHIQKKPTPVHGLGESARKQREAE